MLQKIDALLLFHHHFDILTAASSKRLIIMTNYDKWEQWNADEESEKVSAREGSDQLEQTAAKDEKKFLAQLGKMEVQTKQVAEAFRSQAAVDALKAKGGMRSRRKRGTTDPSASIATASPPAVTDITNTAKEERNSQEVSVCVK